MRVSCGRRSSPRQYAPAIVSSLTALIGLVRRDVRAAAEVREAALRIERDAAVLEAVDKLELVRVALLGLEVGERLGLGDRPARERLVAAGELEHLVLEGR